MVENLLASLMSGLLDFLSTRPGIRLFSFFLFFEQTEFYILPPWNLPWKSQHLHLELHLCWQHNKLQKARANKYFPSACFLKPSTTIRNTICSCSSCIAKIDFYFHFFDRKFTGTASSSLFVGHTVFIGAVVRIGL